MNDDSTEGNKGMCILWFHRPRHSRCRPTSCARSLIRSMEARHL